MRNGGSGESTQAWRRRAHRRGQVQVAGQTAVMAINGLLTKVIFDRTRTMSSTWRKAFRSTDVPSPDAVRIIMKINRQPVPEITEEMMRKDHESEQILRTTRRRLDHLRHDYRGNLQICGTGLPARDFTGFKGIGSLCVTGLRKRAFQSCAAPWRPVCLAVEPGMPRGMRPQTPAQHRNC